MKSIQMKNQMLVFAALFVFVGTSLLASTPVEISPLESEWNRWEKLGQKKVKYALDRDEIVVTRLEGTFNAVKFKVLRGGINMHKCTIHFGNGEKQTVTLKSNFSRGGESRVIDLKGGNRVIKKVVFWYDTKNYADKKAVLMLFGRH